MKPFAVGTFGNHDFEILGEVEGRSISLARVFGASRLSVGDTLNKRTMETMIPGALERAREMAAARPLKLCLLKVLADYRTLAGRDERLIEEAESVLAFAVEGVQG